jgi:diguanylate cyclase (GGDEF)-like protein
MSKATAVPRPPAHRPAIVPVGALEVAESAPPPPAVVFAEHGELSLAEPGAALRGALLDSRQRWRDLVNMASDFAFETDSWGRFVFIAPDPALGWPASTLLGQTAELLLADAGGAPGFNPFRPTAPVRRRRAWLKRIDGSSICLNFAAVPLLDEAGRIVGARGVAHDMSEQERREAEVAGALRRGEVLDHILWRMRKEVLAPRMMQAALDALSLATGCEGLTLLDTLGNGIEPSVLYATGRQVPSVVVTALGVLERTPEEPGSAVTQDGRVVLVCPTHTRFGGSAALLMWREPGSRPWDGDERMLASATAAIVRVILEHDSIQREMARQARTDPLTGLLNRRAFMDELSRRFDRLEVDGLPGALLFIDLDNFKGLNDSRGHDAGDEALRLVAQTLRGMVRPMDLVARLGGDEFALWLDGADEFAAAERAEQLRTSGPAVLAHLNMPGVAPVTMSIGIASRWPGRGEDAELLVQRADQAMYAVKRAGRANWRVGRPEDDP